MYILLNKIQVARASATDGGPLPAAKIRKCIFVKGRDPVDSQGVGVHATGLTFSSSEK